MRSWRSRTLLSLLKRPATIRDSAQRSVSALKEQLSVLGQADIVILNEIDDGVDRENYHNVPRDLATALHMNYAFAVEFLELNRIYMGVKNTGRARQAACRSREQFRS